MKTRRLHDWDLPPKAAVTLQRELAERVVRESSYRDRPRWIAGVDVSCTRFGQELFAGVVVWDAEKGEVVESAGVTVAAAFPYVPGLLSFREAPGILEAVAKLNAWPDVVLVDGNGLAHPRRFGLACHLGIWLDLPTIGCAKSRLLGTYRQPATRRGSACRLVDRGEVVGRVLRTRDGVRPVFVSVGHKTCLEDAVHVVLASCRGYRLPEPIRLAHQYVNALRRQKAG